MARRSPEVARATNAKGVAAASAAAGPLFLAALAMANAPPIGSTQEVGPGLVFAVFSIPFGFAIAALPNYMATALLVRLGHHNAGVRLPVFWALAGGGFGWGLDAMIAAVSRAPTQTPLFALIGPSCALLCRWGAHWAD
jgi:hypothetical protein